MKSKIDEIRTRRIHTQPIFERSAGCVFKNPPGDHAGRLIDEAGLKGESIGNAVVSEVHANFIVNRGGATANDVLRLIDKIRNKIEREFGTTLELEIIKLGFES